MTKTTYVMYAGYLNIGHNINDRYRLGIYDDKWIIWQPEGKSLATCHRDLSLFLLVSIQHYG